ncbi:hypothetical protein AGMMS49940_21740 [Spirochaetia bacterium]|nr:hypothetical protein AGMMS49940_21740 [Spirochaetia bacterium]
MHSARQAPLPPLRRYYIAELSGGECIPHASQDKRIEIKKEENLTTKDTKNMKEEGKKMVSSVIL